MVAGPPFIHNRMHDRFGLVLVSSAAWASLPIKPDIDTAVLTAPTRSKWRRVRRESNSMAELRMGERDRFFPSFPRSAWERVFGRSASFVLNHRGAVDRAFPRGAWERGQG